MSNFSYFIGTALYLNITNRCTNHCSFCIRDKCSLFNQQHPLWLEKEPNTEEILQAIAQAQSFSEIVFCGYGEPLLRLPVVKAVCQRIKTKYPAVPIRINTNGQANLFWDRNILVELKNLINKMVISLNAHTAQVYHKLCHSYYQTKAFTAILDFAREAKEIGIETTLTVVEMPKINLETCHQLATELGVNFRVRPYYEKEYVN